MANDTATIKKLRTIVIRKSRDDVCGIRSTQYLVQPLNFENG